MKWKCEWRFSVVFILMATLSTIPYSEQYGSGAPPTACETQLPIHPGTSPQVSAPPYNVRSAGSQVWQGNDIKVTISGLQPISGFFLQARSVQDNTKKLGSWSKVPTGAQLKTCTTTNDSVTHTAKDDKSTLEFQWKAPDDFLGSVVFRATVLQEYGTYWGKVDSSLVEVVPRGTNIPTTPVGTTNRPPTTETMTTPPISSVPTPKPNNAFYDGCGSRKLCFGSEPKCLDSQNCKAVVSVTVRGEAYTFELLGKAPGYVGVGLSADKLMGDDSVMECANMNGKISTFTSWTYPKVDPYVTRKDVDQSIIRPLKGSLIDGSIYCEFTRDANSVVKDTKFDLVNDKFYLLLVSGAEARDDHVGFHTDVFVSTGEKVSLSDVKDVAGASKILLRLHGAFMLIAWIGTASCGILLARYFRNTWVGSTLGGKDLWFAWHRIFMVSTWLLTMAAFVIILVEVGGWAGTGDNAHAITGIVTIVLCFLQPIGAFFRPHPNTPKRPVFNWIHWFMGNAAHILGIVTIFFAVYLNKAELPGWVVYILVAFVAFHVIMHIILSIAVCVSDGRMSNGRVNSFPMKDLNTRQSMNHDRRADAPHSQFRKLLLVIYFAILLIFVIVLVCLIALAPIEETYDTVSKALSGKTDDKN